MCMTWRGGASCDDGQMTSGSVVMAEYGNSAQGYISKYCESVICPLNSPGIGAWIEHFINREELLKMDKQELLRIFTQSVKITSVIYVTMKLLNQLDDNGPKTWLAHFTFKLSFAWEVIVSICICSREIYCLILYFFIFGEHNRVLALVFLCNILHYSSNYRD